MTTGYYFDLACPGCARGLQHKASGAVSLTGTAAVATCTDCGAVVRIDVRVTIVDRLPVALDDGVTWDEQAPGAPLIRALMAPHRKTPA